MNERALPPLPTGSIPGEILLFGKKQLLACLFGGALLAALLLTRETPTISGLCRSDFLFLYALGLQVLLILFRLEHPREVAVILVFHVLATAMEWFKTSPAIGSWHYPSEGVIFRVYQVPLFAGFLYSAVGSYIARAWRLFDFRFDRYPPVCLTVILAALAYGNFFTHHYLPDIRWVLIVSAIALFARCRLHFRVGRTYRRLPLLLGFAAVAAAIWIAENIGTYARAWVYPTQEEIWHPVHWQKIPAWFLLMMLSFVLVSLIQRDSLRGCRDGGGTVTGGSRPPSSR